MHKGSTEGNNQQVTEHKDKGKSWTTFLMDWSLAIGGTVGIGVVTAWQVRSESWIYVLGITAGSMAFAGLVCVLIVKALSSRANR